MPRIDAFEEDLLRQALSLEASSEAIYRARSGELSKAERDRDLTFAMERVAKYRALVERMLRDLGQSAP